MENERPRNLKDCLIKWEDEEERTEYLEYNCGYDVTNPVGVEECAKYFKVDYDIKKLEWLSINSDTDYTDDYYCAYVGLAKMFNDGWLKSPTNVDWRYLFNFNYIDPNRLNTFLSNIYEPQTCLDILNHLINNVAYLDRRNSLPKWKNWRDTYKAEIKARKEELAKQAAEERKKTKREKPELSLSLDEMIEYVQNVNSDGAQSIQAMLLWAATHKEGWLSASIIKKIDSINKKSDIYVDNKGTTNIIPNATFNK